MTAPQLVVQIQGVTSVSADNLNTYVQWCSNVAELRAFIGSSYMQVYAQGLSAPDDGGQGNFVWFPNVNQADDGENYIIPPGSGGGGWVRLGPILVSPIPDVTGQLSAVTDVNAKAILTSLITALASLGIITNATT